MKVKDLKEKKILVKYGPLNEPYKYGEDLLRWFGDNAYEGDYPFEETQFKYSSHLSKVPYSQTDRASMPPHYQCMGSMTLNFTHPLNGNISPFAFVAFRHTEQKHYHHNIWIYWRTFDDKPGASDRVHCHDRISLSDDIQVSLWVDGQKVFKETIPGKK